MSDLFVTIRSILETELFTGVVNVLHKMAGEEMFYMGDEYCKSSKISTHLRDLLRELSFAYTDFKWSRNLLTCLRSNKSIQLLSIDEYISIVQEI